MHALEIGKMPPQALELEEIILGACLMEKDVIITVSDILKSANSFYKEIHQEIYISILEQYQAGNPHDIIAITHNLRAKGKLDFVGGPGYLSQLTHRVGSGANIGYHSMIVSQKFVGRQLIALASKLQRQAFEEETDVLELLYQGQQDLISLSNNIMPGKELSLRQISTGAMEAMRKAGENNGILGIPSGLPSLDRFTFGWQPGSLIIIAARPRMGKTSLALLCARNAAIKFKQPGAIFSLEMTSQQLFISLLSMEASVENTRLRLNDIHDYENAALQRAVAILENAPLYIDDTSAISEADFRSKCIRLKAEKNIQWVIVDYLQQMRCSRRTKDRNEVVTEICAMLKRVAKDLGIAVIALSQLSRECDKRTDKRPVLSDLRDSGSIEQDADQVIFIYRPEVYGETEDERGNSLQGVAELIIAKNRSGKEGIVEMIFNGKYTRFQEIIST